MNEPAPTTTPIARGTIVTVYLVRHGRTAFNASGAWRGHADVPLDEVGQAEAADLGRAFATTPLALVVTSPLARARLTGEPIARSAGVEPEVDDRLTDRDYGPFTGLSPLDAGFSVGQVLAEGPGIEPVKAVVARVEAALGDIVRRLADANPPAGAVVAHDVINRLALARLVPGLGSADDIPQRTGCWNKLRYGPDGWQALVVDALPGEIEPS
ncbi:MAG: histidine phosphatase family protein [Acidimicrobiales bacterium]